MQHLVELPPCEAECQRPTLLFQVDLISFQLEHTENACRSTSKYMYRPYLEGRSQARTRRTATNMTSTHARARVRRSTQIIA